MFGAVLDNEIYLRWHDEEKPVTNGGFELFVAGATARTAASLVGVNKATASYYFHRLRQVIETQSETAEWLTGEIEIDESYFGGKRKGKRGRGAPGKVHC